jgi:hypothetical protein
MVVTTGALRFRRGSGGGVPNAGLPTTRSAQFTNSAVRNLRGSSDILHAPEDPHTDKGNCRARSVRPPQEDTLRKQFLFARDGSSYKVDWRGRKSGIRVSRRGIFSCKVLVGLDPQVELLRW